ncbi:MAG TPA: DUF4129 domain-containing protein [Pyrinomonadaceae bacterium]|nr:DUF4129 domain-containing protein [Pyrinomonadaceae bacterium]
MNAAYKSKHIAFVLAVALVGLFLCAGAARSATLNDYADRLSRSIALVEQIRAAYADENSLVRSEQVAGGLSPVRQYLPAQETVTVNGQPVKVDNSWLEADIRDFEKSTKADDRRDALARISERLQAIHEHVLDLQKGTRVASDKDADKGRLAEILRRPEYNVHPQPQSSALESLIDGFFRWLSRLFPKPKPIQPGSSRFVGNIVQLAIIALCVAGIGLLIWRYGPRLISGRRKKKKRREARIVLGERLEPDQTAADLLVQAENLARQGNLRAAIRKGYIALLCELGDRKIISLAHYKTNRDYLNAVRDKGSLYPSMRKLTSIFELHWYGFAPAGEAEWNEFRDSYRKVFRE